MKVICISGKAQHGKDTTATIFKSILTEKGSKAIIFHYADLLKYLCKQYFEWDGEKDEKGRSLLQYIGTNIVRERRPDFWVEFAKSFIELFEDSWDYIIIPDCRFPNEIDVMKEFFNGIHIRVVRPNFMSPLNDEQQNHPSETSLDNYPYDYLIENKQGYIELEQNVINIISKI